MIELNKQLAMDAIHWMISRHGTDNQKDILTGILDNLDDEDTLRFAEAVFSVVLDKGLTNDLNEVLTHVYGLEDDPYYVISIPAYRITNTGR